MKVLTKKLELNKFSIQILDDKNLVDLQGGVKDKDETILTCHYLTCNADPTRFQ